MFFWDIDEYYKEYKIYEAVLLTVVALHIVISGTAFSRRYFFLLKKIFAFVLLTSITTDNGYLGLLMMMYNIRAIFIES